MIVDYNRLINLCNYISTSIGVPCSDADDYAQMGCIIALKSIKEYDSNRGVPFWTYLARKLRWRMYDSKRSIERTRARKSAKIEFDSDAITKCYVEHRGFERVDTRDWVQHIMHFCSDMERVIIQGLFEGEPKVAIASSLGVDPARISRSLKSIREKILELNSRPCTRSVIG